MKLLTLLFAAFVGILARAGLVLGGSSFPNGTIFSLGTTYGGDVAVSAISNANPGVATAAGAGYATGAIILLDDLPSRLDGRVVRAASATSGSFALEGINTTNTTRYPSGFGVGSVKEVLAWTAISQVTDTATSGGEQQFYQWVYLDDGRQRQRPTFRNARALRLTLDWDPDLSWHDALLEAAETQDRYALRAALPNGDFLFYGVYVGYDGEPTFTVNENMKTQVDFALASPFSTRY